MNGTKQAVVALIFNAEDKILGITRRDTIDDWGLPGGKVDPNESLIDALIREIKEETNLELDPNKFSLIFIANDGPYEVSTFQYHDVLVDKPTQGDSGIVGWIDWDDLFRGSFGSYNKQLKHITDQIIF